jgi:nitrogen fixation NifU-like protein
VKDRLFAPSSNKRWLGLLSYFPNPTCVNNIARKKAKLLQTVLTVALSTIQSWAHSIILMRGRSSSRIITRRLGFPWDALQKISVFNDVILDHFRAPHNAGDLPDATAIVEVTNPVCGDVLRLAVRVETGRITAARFKTQGCVAAIACSSLLTDMLIGKSPPELHAISPQQISESLGNLPPATFHAAQLCTDAVAALLKKIN